MHYLKRAEKICLSGQEKECHALLFRIYLLQIRKVGKKDDLIDKMIEEDFDESSYLEGFENQICELARKAEKEIQSDTADAEIPVKSMMELALEVNDALEDDLFLFPPQEKE